MMAHFMELLKAIVKKPEQIIASLPMLLPQERIQLLEDFNETKTDYSAAKNVVHLFEEQVTKSPGSIAIIFEAQQLTYKELNQRANELARYLVSKGVQKDALVPICIERSNEMMVGILGILKAGGAYVPIDPNYPQERIAFMLEDTAAMVLVTDQLSKSKLPDNINAEIIELDGDWETINRQAADNISITVQPNQLAYVIYTSGSTGKPKGVLIEHKSLVNYLLATKDKYLTGQKGGSGSFVHLSYTFDASLTAMFIPLISGKSVVIGSKQGIDVFDDHNFYKYAPYDFIKLTPAHLELLEDKMVSDDGNFLTHKLVIGGEALRPGHFNYLINNGIDVTIVNEYGPTEATVGCTIYCFNTLGDNKKLKHNISIGKPIENTGIYILNESDELSGVGVIGELCIGGDGLARGYLNRPELSAERFVANPFSNVKGARIYKTGDLGRWLPDGNIEYLGRVDDQVKIRGYRVELGEIENVLERCELVRQAAVLVKESKDGNKRLVAYIVPETAFDREGVMIFLKEQLPDYMVPAILVSLDALPLTVHGKIDRKALPDTDSGEQIKNAYLAPRNETEATLVNIWQELLDVERVGIQDNFFDLGGDSIIIIQVVSRARRAGLELQVADVFNHQTVDRLSEVISQRLSTINKEEVQVPLTGEAGLLPIQQWYFEKSPVDISHYNQAVLLKIDKAVPGMNLKRRSRGW
jgi:amino acid adenylation domain-containing protein